MILDKREPTGSLFRLWTIALGMVLVANAAQAQRFDMNARCRDAYRLIYDLQVQQAEALIRAERTANPDNLIVLMLEDQVDFVVNVLTESPDEFKRRETARDGRMERLEEYEGRSPFHRLCMAEVNLHWALARIRQGEYLTAALEIRAAFKLLEENQVQYPKFQPNLKGLGLLHTLVGTVPAEYDWAVKVMGMNGSVEKGMNELRSVMDLSRSEPQLAYLETETVFLYTLLHVNLLNKPEQYADLEKFVKAGANNSPLTDFALVSIYRKQKKNDAAIDVIEAGMRRPDRYPFPYLRYLLGELKLYRFDADADNWLRLYTNSFRGKSYMRSAQQKRAWYALTVKNSEKDYLDLIGKINALPASTLDEDSQAKREGEMATAPNVHLLRARLRYDGGYLTEALTELAKLDPKKLNVDQTLELTYRKARIVQDQGKTDEAIALYTTATQVGRASKTYYAANASLQLGLIYEKKGDKEKARQHFVACQSFAHTEYRNSIEQKAKAGLNRLGK